MNLHFFFSFHCHDISSGSSFFFQQKNKNKKKKHLSKFGCKWLGFILITFSLHNNFDFLSVCLPVDCPEGKKEMKFGA